MRTTNQSESTRVPPVAAIAARFADHWRGFAGDRTFIDAGGTDHDFAVTGHQLGGFDQDMVATAQFARFDKGDCRIALRACQLFRQDVLARAAQRGGLRLATPLGERLGEVGEQQREPQPQAHPEDEARRRFAVAGQCLDPQQGGQHAAYEDHEHHRIAELQPRRQLAERIDHGLENQVTVEAAHGMGLRIHRINALTSGIRRSGQVPEPEGK
jgi:hypothetical protein